MAIITISVIGKARAAMIWTGKMRVFRVSILKKTTTTNIYYHKIIR